MNWLKTLLGGNEKSVEQVDTAVSDNMMKSMEKNELYQRVVALFNAPKIAKTAAVSTLIEDDRRRYVSGLSYDNLAGILAEVSLIAEEKSVQLNFHDRYPEMLELVLKNRKKAEEKLLSYAPMHNMLKKASTEEVLESADKSEKFMTNESIVDATQALVSEDANSLDEQAKNMKKASMPSIWSVENVNGVDTIVKILQDPYAGSSDPVGVSFSLLSSIGIIKNNDIVEVHGEEGVKDYIVAGLDPFAVDGKFLKLAYRDIEGVKAKVERFMAMLAEQFSLKPIAEKNILVNYGRLSTDNISELKIEKKEDRYKYDLKLRVRNGKVTLVVGDQDVRQYNLDVEDCDIVTDDRSPYLHVTLNVFSNEEQAEMPVPERHPISNLASIKYGIHDYGSISPIAEGLPEISDDSLRKVIDVLRRNNIATSSVHKNYILLKNAYEVEGADGLIETLRMIKPGISDTEIDEIVGVFAVAFQDEAESIPAKQAKDDASTRVKIDGIDDVIIRHLAKGSSLRAIAMALHSTPADVYLHIEKNIKPRFERIAKRKLSRGEFIKFAVGVAGHEQKTDDLDHQVPAVFADMDRKYTKNKTDGGEIQGANTSYPETESTGSESKTASDNIDKKLKKFRQKLPPFERPEFDFAKDMDDYYSGRLAKEIERTEKKKVKRKAEYASYNEIVKRMQDSLKEIDETAPETAEDPNKNYTVEAAKRVYFNPEKVKEYNKSIVDGISADITSEAPEGVRAKTPQGKEIAVKKEDITGIDAAGSKILSITEPFTGKVSKYVITACGDTEIEIVNPEYADNKMKMPKTDDEEEIKAFISFCNINKASGKEDVHDSSGAKVGEIPTMDDSEEKTAALVLDKDEADRTVVVDELEKKSEDAPSK